MTVPKGKFQLETSFLSFTQDDHSNGHAESWVFAETNFKFGLTQNTDIQLVVAPFLYERDLTEGVLTESEGFGDLTLRFKWNLWGNDEGSTALGLLPYVKIPVQTEMSNDHWEGGLIMPFSWEWTERLSFGFQVEVASNYDDAVGQHWAFAHTAVLGIALTDQLGLYLEYVGQESELPYEAFASGGLTCLVHDDLQFDVGLLRGLNDDSSDLVVFTGVTRRF